MSEDKKLDDILKEQLAALPPPVRSAIMSADVEKGLRELADKHKLHLDQWQTLENEVMLSLIGLEPIAKLEENIKEEVGVGAETARALVSDIGEIVFEPIRRELERELENPTNPEKEVSKEKEDALMTAGTAPAPRPPTPPAPPPIEKAQRLPVSAFDAPQEKSHERKDIEGDPYREQVA